MSTSGTGRRPPPARLAHHTVEERVARGRAARRATPRSLHAELPAPAGRPDPVGILQDQATHRIPELLPIRYGRMLASPFTFFRGAAAVMADDLARTPSSGLRVQLCGDAHLSNFGVFGTPERRLVFDINDFDETLPGPFEWDVKRLAASFVVAARNNGFGATDREAIVQAGVSRYRTAMAGFARMGNLDVFYASPDVEDLLAGHLAGAGTGTTGRKMTRQAERMLARARTRDGASAIRRFTHEVDGERRIASDPPLTTPMSELLGPVAAEDFQHWAAGLLREYRRTLATDRRRLVEGYRMVDLARRVVGVGSVGTGAWIVLLVGRDTGDPLVLQVKEAPPSVLERHLGRSEYRNGGHRVVAGQRLMQATGDIFLGWIRQAGLDGRERDFYVRQFRDWKGSVEVERMRPEGMSVYAELCGWTLARAHARSGDRVALAAYMGKGRIFDRAIAAFAEAYADRNAADHASVAAAADAGRIAATYGV
jgi:uncharacterized protein (DUF2252 family)